MAEASPYPGSPSLSPEAREKVRQTFRHTIQLAKSGRNEEALLGCDFILKMDARFQPARRLLETLRGVATGTIVDLSPFSEWVDGASSASMPVMPTSPRMPATAPAVRRPSSPTIPNRPSPESSARPSSFAGPAPAAPPPGPASLDDLAFDDFAMGAPPSAPPAPARPSSAAFPASRPSMPAIPVQPPPAPLDYAPDFDADPGATAAVGPLSYGEPPEALPSPQPGGLGEPFGAPPDPFATAMAPPLSAPMPAAPPPSADMRAAVDPRIAQFLNQGDEAMTRGQVQEAIDLWSRVFLIDLANEEASQRIDAARERQAETGRKIDILLSDGIHQYDAGDYAGARAKFLDVLALSENDTTARNYLNQIDAALAEKNAVTLGGSADFMKSELEAPSIPSFAPPDDVMSRETGFGGEVVPVGESIGEQVFQREEAPRPRKKIKLRLDPRILGAALLLVIAAVVFLVMRKPSKTTTVQPPKRTVLPKDGAPADGAPSEAPQEDVIAKAQLLIEQGKCPDAEPMLLGVAPTAPRYADALRLLEICKGTPPQVPGGPPVAEASSAALDEKRIAGLAAAKASHYIDAVKNLDPVVKARPEDVEAGQVLAKARERVAAIGSAVKAYNEQDYTTAIRLLWDLRKQDARNQDVEEFLFKAYYNEGIIELQAGNAQKAAESLKEAVAIHPNDAEAQRHLKFVKRYSKGATDLLSRIYIKHLSPRP